MLCRTDIVKKANPCLFTYHPHRHWALRDFRVQRPGWLSRYNDSLRVCIGIGAPPWGARFFYPSRPTLKPTMGAFFPEEKRPRSGVVHPPPSRALAFKACCRAIFTFLAHSSLIQCQDFMHIGIYTYILIFIGNTNTERGAVIQPCQ
jgi:hypothetical protein